MCTATSGNESKWLQCVPRVQANFVGYHRYGVHRSTARGCATPMEVACRTLCTACVSSGSSVCGVAHCTDGACVDDAVHSRCRVVIPSRNLSCTQPGGRWNRCLHRSEAGCPMRRRRRSACKVNGI